MKPLDEFSHHGLFAVDIEKQIIAAMLEGSTHYLPEMLRILPDARAFAHQDCRRVWSHVQSLHRAGEAVSLVTLRVALRRDAEVRDADDMLALLLGTHAIISARHAEWHAQQVAYAYARRESLEALRLMQSADAVPADLAAALREQLQRIEAVGTSTHTLPPQPCQLVAKLAPVQPFDPAWLPSTLRPWITDIAERMQCPPEFPAVAAMAALSSVAGRRFCIQPKEQDESYTEFPHLWAMLIGNPSLMKSPAMQAAMRPLREMERVAFKEYEGLELERQAAELAAKYKLSALEAEARKAEKKGEYFNYEKLIQPAGGSSSSTALRRFIVNDASIEALGEVLKENPTGTLLYQDELAGLLALLEKDGNQSLRAFLLQAWSGKEGFTFDRIGRGRRHIESCAVSLLGSIQPGVIATHVRAANGHTSGADGFLQRFSLMVWPDVNPQWKDIDRPLDPTLEWDAQSVFDSIENVLPEQLIKQGVQRGRDGIPTYRFTPEAQARFSAWRDPFEQRLRSGSLPPAFEAHLGKYRKLVPALALLIHTAETLYGDVPLSALERALSWTACLETHAARVFGSGVIAENNAVHTLLKKLCDGMSGLPEEFKIRDIRRKCWAGLSRQEEAESACEMLADHRWLIATMQPAGVQGGRPCMSYRLNPLAKDAM